MHNNKAAAQAQNTKHLQYNFKIFKCDNITRQKVIWGRPRHALKSKAQRHGRILDIFFTRAEAFKS